MNTAKEPFNRAVEGFRKTVFQLQYDRDATRYHSQRKGDVT